MAMPFGEGVLNYGTHERLNFNVALKKHKVIISYLRKVLFFGTKAHCFWLFES